MEEISGSLAERGPEIAATLAEARVAIRQAGDAAEEFGELADTTDQLLADDARPLINDLQQTVQAAEQRMKNPDMGISEAGPGGQACPTPTSPENTQAVLAPGHPPNRHPPGRE